MNFFASLLIYCQCPLTLELILLMYLYLQIYSSYFPQLFYGTVSSSPRFYSHSSKKCASGRLESKLSTVFLLYNLRSCCSEFEIKISTYQIRSTVSMLGSFETTPIYSSECILQIISNFRQMVSFCEISMNLFFKCLISLLILLKNLCYCFDDLLAILFNCCKDLRDGSERRAGVRVRFDLNWSFLYLYARGCSITLKM